jgi:hypothetical protein
MISDVVAVGVNVIDVVAVGGNVHGRGDAATTTNSVIVIVGGSGGCSGGVATSATVGTAICLNVVVVCSIAYTVGIYSIVVVVVAPFANRWPARGCARYGGSDIVAGGSVRGAERM